MKKRRWNQALAMLLTAAILFTTAGVPALAAEVPDSPAPPGQTQEEGAPGAADPAVENSSAQEPSTEDSGSTAQPEENSNAGDTATPEGGTVPEDSTIPEDGTAPEGGTVPGDGSAPKEEIPPAEGSADTAQVTMVISFEELEDSVKYQEVSSGTPLGELVLPTTLGASGYAISSDTQTPDSGVVSASIVIEGVTWELDAAHNGGVTEYDETAEAGSYVFTPVLPESYLLADGAALPEIQVHMEAVSMLSNRLMMGAFTLMADQELTYGEDCTFSNNTLTILSDKAVTIRMTASGEETITDRILVKSGLEVDITLDGVKIDVSGPQVARAFDMSGATVNLTLKGENSLKSGVNCAGLKAPDGAILTIDGPGSLTATGGQSGAGIGGDFRETGGAITINGGVVTATGGSEGVGIGGGANVAGGAITINGGTVTANGGTALPNVPSSSAAIHSGVDGTITISGGTVTANGGIIGNAGVITINDGTVIADGGDWNPGIGGVYHSINECTITIRGGDVTATGNVGAGIGGTSISSRDGDTGGTINICGGKITATSTTGAGIGGGGGGNSRRGGTGGTITISGGTVTAISEVGAGIGGGGGDVDGTGGTITISGGTVTATSTKCAGIGGADGKSSGFVTIRGGMVTATSTKGAGIGGTFSTEENGGAQIFAKSEAGEKAILDDEDKSGWSGIIFQNENGAVYGGPTLGTDINIPSGYKLTIGIDATLTVGEGVILTNDGNIYVGGIMTGSGTIDNQGIITKSSMGTVSVRVVGNGVRPTGEFVLSADGPEALTDEDYEYVGDTLTIKSGKAVTIGMMPDAQNPTTDKIVVESGVHAQITLDDVNIDVSATMAACAFDMTEASVTLTLKGENSLKSGRNKAGLQAPAGSTLTIDGTGSLTATGGSFCAGIGGSRQAVGAITVNGGRVTATGGIGGVGIGGGADGGAGSTVTINGGTVTATSGDRGAGIGDVGVAITISGGSVMANGGYNGIGIDGRFSTGKNGSALIVAKGGNGKKAIEQDNDKSDWSGVIFLENRGAVYGNPTLGTDGAIPANHLLTIDTGHSVTVENDVTLTNAGEILEAVPIG